MTSIPEADPWAGTDSLAEYGAPEGFSANGHAPPPGFERCDLASLVRDGIPAPELLCQDLLYAGSVHSLSGPPDCGKSTFLCWTALNTLRSGRPFMLLDEESGPAQYGEKLRDMGATPEELENLFYYPFPGKTWDAEDNAALAALVADVRPAILAWDSAGAFLARAGLDENVAADVTRWTSQVLQPCTRLHNTAVIIADHDVKATSSTRYARGSGAKLAGVDVQFKLEALTPFSRTVPGTLRLSVTKDRRGHLHRWHKIAVTPGKTLTLTIADVSATEASNLTPLQMDVLAVLGATPQTTQWVTDTVSHRTGRKHVRQVISRTLNELADLRLSDRMDMGPGSPTYWSKL